MMEKNSRGQRDEYALGAVGHFDWRKGFEEVSSSRRFIVLEMERRGVEWNCGGVGVCKSYSLALETLVICSRTSPAITIAPSSDSLT